MASVDAWTGVVGAVAGVLVGSLVTAWTQRALLKEGHRREDQRAMVDACVSLLTAYRSFRGYVITAAPDVRVLTTPEGERFPLVDDARTYYDATQEATARVMLLCAHNEAVLAAMREVYDTFEAVAIAKADDPVIPEEVIAAARTAEVEFGRIVHRELINSG